MSIEAAVARGRASDSPDGHRAASKAKDLADVAFAEALLSLVYAIEIVDADGAILSAGNVALRHDFGFRGADEAARSRIAWGVPKQEIIPGVPWHVIGSLIGLDVALAPLALRRISTEHLTAPSLLSNERENFAISVVLMNPSALSDADRELMVQALERGRIRVAALTADNLDAAARDIDMDGWRRRAAQWMLAHDRSDLPSLFSLPEVVRLGGGAGAATLDAWGMSAIAIEGCLCTRFAPPGRWTLWTGRPQFGLVSVTVADLNVQVAEMLRELRLPAGLTQYVLTAAVQDFIDEVRTSDPDDWLSLVRAARLISRERLEDYVAAAAADGPLVPDGAAGQIAERHQ